MSDYLPEDILINILSRLPVKTLLQLRCISKTWHSLISSPAFIIHHLNKATIRNNDLLFFRIHDQQDGHCHYSLYPDEDFPKCNGQEIEFPLEMQKSDPNQRRCCEINKLVGSSNGLFFVYHLYFDYCKSTHIYRTALWNPSIRKTVPIPRSPTFNLDLYYENYFGLGFDSIYNDCKLVRVGYLKRKLPPLVEVYSMNSECRRMVDNDLKYFISMYSPAAAFVNGACHWAAKTDEWVGEINVIMYFNLADEKFGETIVPNGVVCKHWNALTVTVFDGLLSLVELNTGYHGASNSAIWAMERYGDSKSWTKLINIEYIKGFHIGGFLGLKKNGEMFIDAEEGLTSYPKNGSWRFWGIYNKSCLVKFVLDSYTESLVLLNEANGVSKERSSHVVELVSKEDEEERKGKKNMGSPELVGVENGALLRDASSSSATLDISSNNEGNGVSEVIDSAKNRKQKEKKKKKKNMESDDFQQKHNSSASASADTVENGTHEAPKKLPSSNSKTDKKKAKKKKKGKN